MIGLLKISVELKHEYECAGEIRKHEQDDANFERLITSEICYWENICDMSTKTKKFSHF